MRDIIVKRITPQTFCALAPIMPVMTSREEGQAGRKIARTNRATASYADVFLRVLGIDIAFGREGRAGTRVIRIRTRPEIPSEPSTCYAITITILGRANRSPSPLG